jgi:hypothetical protein
MGYVGNVKGSSNSESRARAYVFAAKFPNSIEGQNGHGRLYHVACVLVNGFGLSRQQALPILEEWNQGKAEPPESDGQVQHKLDDAIKNNPRPSLSLLNAKQNERMHLRAARSDGPEGITHDSLEYKDVLPGPSCVTSELTAPSCVTAEVVHPSCVTVAGKSPSCVTALPLDIQEIVGRHARASAGVPLWQSIFGMRREVEPMLLGRCWSTEDWGPIAGHWVSVCREQWPDSSGFDEVWTALREALKKKIKVKCGDGEDGIRARIPYIDVPPELVGNPRLSLVYQVMKATADENSERGRTVFRAPLRFIGKLAGGINQKLVDEDLQVISKIGYLSRVKVGTQGTLSGGKASEWSWYDPPRPGETVWDYIASATTSKRRVAGKPSGPAPADQVKPYAVPEVEPGSPGEADASVQELGELAKQQPLPFVARTTPPSEVPSEILNLRNTTEVPTPLPMVELHREVASLSSYWHTRWITLASGLERERGMQACESGLLALAQVKAEMDQEEVVLDVVDPYDREERAAIMEFDGGLTREAAEIAAGLRIAG